MSAGMFLARVVVGFNVIAAAISMASGGFILTMLHCAIAMITLPFAFPPTLSRPCPREQAGWYCKGGDACECRRKK